MNHDSDLDAMTHKQLVGEATKLRDAIRKHRDSSGHDLCWYHPDLWAFLPEASGSTPAVPPWPQFMRGCVAYRASLDAQLLGATADEREFDDSDCDGTNKQE